MGILNERIKTMRIKRGYTLAYVAELLGIKEATMQRYESGEIKNIRHETISKLAEIYKCSPTYLMGWDEIDKEPENDYQLLKSLLKKNGADLSYIGTVIPIDEKKEQEFYFIYVDKTGYKISINEYHSLKKDIDSFVRFKISELTDDNHKLKPILNKTNGNNSLKLKAAHNDNADDPEQQRLMAEDMDDMENNW